MASRITRELGRFFLKDTVRQQVDFAQTPQSRGEPPPPLQKPVAPGVPLIALAGPTAWQGIAALPLVDAMARRASRREFTAAPLTLDELAFLLWATQGIRQHIGPHVALRTVPSAGARHAFECYVAVRHVTGLEPGLYRYLPVEHALVLEFAEADLGEALAIAAHGQEFVQAAAAVFVWSAIPARMEWRYGDAAYKVLAIDAGHVGQNLYLACEAVAAGTCAIAAYRQDLMDRLLRLDGQEEFTVYLAPVGHVAPRPG